uniref:Uncharacterized protein n=1 Tax=Setaria italica TaxID=4555 RepID=K4AI04_SETIT
MKGSINFTDIYRILVKKKPPMHAMITVEKIQHNTLTAKHLASGRLNFIDN